MSENIAVNEREQLAIIKLCMLAAMADGAQSELERREIKKVAENFSPKFDLTSAYQQALFGGKAAGEMAAELARAIDSDNGKTLAYEMAVCICSVDGPVNEVEEMFLARLRENLKVPLGPSQSARQTASSIASEPLNVPPVIPPGRAKDAELDQMILNRAILAGALELMPQTLATMAIIPVQMRMVYQVGKSYGYELDLAHAKEFLATVGVGLTSQVVEGYVSKLVHGFARKFADRMVTGLVTQATESAFAFATTYALGEAAKAYYAGGRTLSSEQLRQLFATLINQGRTLKMQYAPDILRRSSELRSSDLVSLAKEI